jgi:hypothetical protein
MTPAQISRLLAALHRESVEDFNARIIAGDYRPAGCPSGQQRDRQDGQSRGVGGMGSRDGARAVVGGAA